jgi:hypothetical protein
VSNYDALLATKEREGIAGIDRIKRISKMKKTRQIKIV